MTRRLNFGPYGRGLTLEQYVLNAFNGIERWSHDVLTRHDDTGPSTLTIATGIITVARGYHLIDTEAAGATDDLTTINGGADGQQLVLRAANSARTVVIKDGTGNIKGPGDFSLDNAEDTCSLIYDAAQSAWLVTATSNNGA